MPWTLVPTSEPYAEIDYWDPDYCDDEEWVPVDYDE